MKYYTDKAAMIEAVPILRRMEPVDVKDEIHSNLAFEGARLR